MKQGCRGQHHKQLPASSFSLEAVSQNARDHLLAVPSFPPSRVKPRKFFQALSIGTQPPKLYTSLLPTAAHLQAQMPPPKARPATEDSPNLSTQKSHLANVQLSSNANGKKRATNANGQAASSGLRDVTAISTLDDTADQPRTADEQGGEVIAYPPPSSPFFSTLYSPFSYTHSISYS